MPRPYTRRHRKVSVRRAVHECGPTDAAKGPSRAHYEWHQRFGEDACPKSRAENAWYTAERLARKPLPDWKTKIRTPYVCGEAEDREQPGTGHRNWDRRKYGKACPKAYAEQNWYDAEKKYGRSIPDWYPGWPGKERT